MVDLHIKKTFHWIIICSFLASLTVKDDKGKEQSFDIFVIDLANAWYHINEGTVN